MCSCVQPIYLEQPKARKEYMCDASLFVAEMLDYIRRGDIKLTFAERRQVVVAKNEGWKIKRGQIYERQVNKRDGDVYIFRGRIEIIKICEKYDLFPCDC